MNLVMHTFKSIEKTPVKILNNFFDIFDGCFPNIFFDKEDIFTTLKKQENLINLYYINDNIVGFICHKNIDENTVCINYLGVNQSKKKYTEQGVASNMLENFINQNPNKEIHLICNAINDRARYLYHKFNFEIVAHAISDLGKKQYHMVLNTNKKDRAIAAIIYEIYKQKINAKKETIEDIFLDMFINQKYDNLYQYDIEDNEINHIIKHSTIFAQCLSILDNYFSFESSPLRGNIFSYISSDLESYIRNDSTTYLDDEQLKNLNNKKINQIFSLLNNKYRDDRECLEIKTNYQK